MTEFQYINFLCEQTQLEPLLNQYGSDGWRLHTCEPVTNTGPFGPGVLQAFVVMDRMFAPETPFLVQEEQAIPQQSVAKNEGIPMKG